MLQQALKVSSRSVSPLIRWMEGWAEITSTALKRRTEPAAVRSLREMPGPSVANFAWDLFANGGLSRLHELQVGGLNEKRCTLHTFQLCL